MNNHISAIILAAGYGKRLGGENQKTLTQILGKPILVYLMSTVKQCNPKKIVVVVGFQKEKVMEQLKGEPVIFVEQKQLLGTGHAVMTAENVLSDFCGNVIVLCGDVPFLSFETINKLKETHENTHADCTILTAIVDSPYGYGRIVRDVSNNITKIVEDINASDEEKQIKEINAGVYIFKNKILFESLKKIKPNPVKNEYYLTDVIEIFISEGRKVSTWTTPSPEETIGINTPEDLEKALQYISSLRRKQ
ncbi:MAG TPA: NTP transferase domain-containing protein [bacterium]|nr:NTP transferase domain-containing protein [bacterium]HOL34922.1 NTP transferase domain-containing protein [bacterium]HPP08242.1 NTP transferase domain-containing protein [bacterium]